MTNAVRGSILFAAKLALYDVLLFIPMLCLFSPLGWLGRRYQPLLKECGCGTTKKTKEKKNYDYEENVARWHSLIFFQFFLLLLDLATLPFLLIVLSPIGMIGLRAPKFWRVLCTWSEPPDTLGWYCAVLLQCFMCLFDALILFPLLIVLSPLGLIGRRSTKVLIFMRGTCCGKKEKKTLDDEPQQQQE